MPSYLVVAYVGPETILPVASVAAAAVGVVLIGWRYFVGGCKKVVRFIVRR